MAVLDWGRFMPSRGRVRTPIGVDFGSKQVSWVQLEHVGAGLRVLDACSVPHAGDVAAFFASGTELAEMVRFVLRRGRFRGRKIVTHAPSQDLRLMVLNYAEQSDQSEESQILDLVRERMQNDLSEHVVDYVPIRTSGDRQGDRSAMVAVVPEAPVIERLEALRRAGLDVTALEIPPVAVRRLIVGALLSRGTGPSAEIALVIRMQERRTELTVVSGRRLLLYREIEVGREAMVAAISKHLDCEADAARDLLVSFGVGDYSGDEAANLSFSHDSADLGDGSGIADSLREIARPELKALAEQAHKAISYTAFQTHGMSIDRVHLMEGETACPGLGGLLSEMLQLPVVPVDPMTWIEPASHLGPGAVDHRLTLALGFALRGAVDE